MTEEGRQGFARRLNQAFDELGVPEKQKGRYTAIAKLFSVTPVAAKDWCDGVSYPGIDKFVQILVTVKKSADWLLFGRSMGQETLVTAPRGEVGGTGPHLRSRHLVDHVAFERTWLQRTIGGERIVVLEMDGDAMTPTLRAGDLVVADIGSPGIGDNGVYLFRLDAGEVPVVRRVHRHLDGTLEISCDNPAYARQVARARYRDGILQAEDGTPLPLTVMGRVAMQLRTRDLWSNG